MPRTQLAFGLVLASMVLICWPGLEQPGQAPREAFLLIAVPFLLALSAWRGSSRPSWRLIGLLSVAVLLGALSTALVPALERTAVLRDLLLLDLLAGAAIAASWWRADSDDEVSVDVGIEFGAIVALPILGLIGLAQGWWGWQGLPQSLPPAGTLVNRNVAAQLLLVTLPLVAPALLAGRRPRLRWAAGLAGGLGLALLIATRSLGGWIAATVGLVLGAAVWWWSAGRRAEAAAHRSWGPAALAGGLAAIALFVPAHGQQQRLPSVREAVTILARADQGSGAIRTALWRNTLVLVGSKPLLGAGPGRFAVEYPLYQAARVATPGFGTERQAEHAHSDLLEFAAELGIPAALALLIAVLGAVYRSGRAALAGNSRLGAARHAARVAGLSAVIVHGLVSFPLHSAASALVFWLLVGRSWASRDARPAGSSSASWPGWMFLALLPLGAWLGAREVQSQAALGRALAARGRGACEVALGDAREVARRAPWRRRDVGMAAMIVFDCQPQALPSLAALEPALAQHPNQINLLLAVGARRLKAGRVEAAVAAFEHAVRIAPGLDRAWLGLAMGRRGIGDRAGSAEACREALRLNPSSPAAAAVCPPLARPRG